jgi:tripartite-type tricarboxylate transporter receptor subunit TctC
MGDSRNEIKVKDYRGGENFVAGKSIDIEHLYGMGGAIAYKNSAVNTDGQVIKFSNNTNGKYNISSRNPFVLKRRAEGNVSIFYKRS